MTFNTRHPVGSTDPRDLYDNATNFDKLMNGPDPSYADRLGKQRHSWSGMEEDFNNAQEGRASQFGASQRDFAERFAAFLQSSGYVDLGNYAAGLNITEYNQTFTRNGVVYRAAYETKLPYQTTGNWEQERTNFVSMGDASLRQDLANATDLSLGVSLIAGAGRVVDSIADLRNLPSTGSRRVFVFGYYGVGDGGGGQYALDPSDTTSTGNGGTVIVANDGGRWKLAQTARISVLQFGAKRNDASFNSGPAIQAAHNALGFVYYPEGKYYSSQAISKTGSFGMQGDGLGKSVVIFTGSTNGYSITQSDSRNPITIRDMSIQTGVASTTTVALLIDGSPQLGGSDGVGHRILNDRISPRALIENMDFRGTTNSVGWGINLQLKSLMNFAVRNITYCGVIPATVGNLQGIGILINGDGVPVDFSIERVWGYYSLYGILMPDYVEGGHIRNYEFVAVTFGIIGRYTAGISTLAESACGCLAMYFDDGHLNVLQAGIILGNTNQCHIENQNIYLQPRSNDARAFGIQLTNGNYNDINGVFIEGGQAQNTKTGNYGVVLSSIGLSTISKIKAANVESAATLLSSTSNTFDDCRANACAFLFSADSASTQNDFSGSSAGLTTGPKFNVPLDNNIRMEEYSGVSSKSIPAGNTANISFSLPIGMFTEAPRFASLTLNQGSIYLKFIYLRSSSSATQASFMIAPASPATTLPAETMEFSVNAKGI